MALLAELQLAAVAVGHDLLEILFGLLVRHKRLDYLLAAMAEPYLPWGSLALLEQDRAAAEVLLPEDWGVAAAE